MTPQDRMYIAVRKTDGREWIDLTCWGYVAQTAIDTAKRIDAELPTWAPANPVIRIGLFELTEIKQK